MSSGFETHQVYPKQHEQQEKYEKYEKNQRLGLAGRFALTGPQQEESSAKTSVKQQVSSNRDRGQNMHTSSQEKLSPLARGLLVAGPPPPRLSLGERARAKQRKWRVLVAIALLLPALAAVIGECCNLFLFSTLRMPLGCLESTLILPQTVSSTTNRLHFRPELRF